jgi:hypothetical protein
VTIARTVEGRVPLPDGPGVLEEIAGRVRVIHDPPDLAALARLQVLNTLLLAGALHSHGTGRTARIHRWGLLPGEPA